MARIEVTIDLNRVEGDLEIGLTLEDGIVVDAKTVGTMYRGFEQIMVGRAPRDAMVITPRVCGICGTAHLYTAALALENAWQLPVPENATRIRNLCLFAENVQSDLRQTFLFFTPDFCVPRYENQPLMPEWLDAFEPFKGKIYRETLKFTRRILEIVAIFGGQWPHSSYMLAGGVVSEPDMRRVFTARGALEDMLNWYEKRVLGVSLDDWFSLASADDYFALLEQPVHKNSALGLLSRFTRSLNLHKVGAGTPHMISYGSSLFASGTYDGETHQISPLNHELINEHVRHSWFRQYEGGLHPWEGETIPDYQPHGDRYTWAKAPRYENKVMQTGTLAKLLINGDALITALFKKEGDSAWLRQFSRVHRVAVNLKMMQQMLSELAANINAPYFIPPPKNLPDGQGFGLVMAARGALGHWVKLKDGVIEKYQIITPTSWNASPRDSAGQLGHWEQSLIGLHIADIDDPVEIGHVIRSHDPCLVCTVHLLDTGKRIRFAP